MIAAVVVRLHDGVSEVHNAGGSGSGVIRRRHEVSSRTVSVAVFSMSTQGSMVVLNCC